MSYDVSIGDDSFNYTYNLHQFFKDHIGFGAAKGIDAIAGLDGKTAVVVLARAFADINRSRHDLGEDTIATKYNPDNKWGSVFGATVFLAQIVAACSMNPEGKVSVS